MRVVSATQLRSNLAAFLRDVRRGDRILIEHRGRKIAELRPCEAMAGSGDSIEAIVAEFEASGELTRAQVSKKRWRWTPRGLGLTRAIADRTLDDERRER